MVTSRHETAHRIFQERPALLAPTFRLLGVTLPEDASVEVLPPDATELKPLERRLDSVLRLSPRDGSPPTMLAIEAQSRPDTDKAVSWAYYLAFLEAKNGCPALLVVVCQDKETAEWASGPFDLGPHDWNTLTVRPLVLGPGNVPVILDPEEAEQDLPMATFAAMTHGRSADAPAILEALAIALGRSDTASLHYYSELLETGLGNIPARQTWRNLMKNGSYFPGRGTLVEETYLEGKAKGEAGTTAAAVLQVLRMRGVPVSAEEEARITTHADPALLNEWLNRALRIDRAEDLFADAPATEKTPRADG